MPYDWSRVSLEDQVSFAQRRASPARGGWDLPRTEIVLAVQSLIVGVMITLLYVWPAEMLISFYTGGFRRSLFVSILLVAFMLATAACWMLTRLEARYWARNWHTVPEFADPPYWR